MSYYYEISSKLDTIQYKLENATDVLEILAEHLCDDPSSGSVWCMRDVIERLADDLTQVSSLAMQYHTEEQEALEAKAKKKKK